MTRSLIVAGLVALAAGLGWWQRHALTAALRTTTAAAQPKAMPGPPAAVARRCTDGSGRVSYTDGTCPAGTREAAVGGQLSVLPMPAPPRAAEPAASATPLLRQLAPDADGPTIRQRMLDKAP